MFLFKTAMFDCGWTTNGRALHDVAVSLPIFLELWLEYILVKLFRLFKCMSGLKQPAAGVKTTLVIDFEPIHRWSRAPSHNIECLFYACVFAYGETFAIFLTRKTPDLATVIRRKARFWNKFLFHYFHHCQTFALEMICIFLATIRFNNFFSNNISLAK